MGLEIKKNTFLNGVSFATAPETRIIKCDKHGDYESKKLGNFLNSVLYQNCPECLKEKEIKKENEILNKKKQDREEYLDNLKDNLLLLGASTRYCSMAFKKKIQNDIGVISELKEYLAFDNDFLLQNSCLINSESGSGKSFFLYKMCEICLLKNKNAKVIKFRDLIDFYKDKYKNLSSLKEFFKDVEIALIDDLHEGGYEDNVPILIKILEICEDLDIRIVATSQNNRGYFEKIDKRLSSLIKRLKPHDLKLNDLRGWVW